MLGRSVLECDRASPVLLAILPPRPSGTFYLNKGTSLVDLAGHRFPVLVLGDILLSERLSLPKMHTLCYPLTLLTLSAFQG